MTETVGPVGRRRPCDVPGCPRLVAWERLLCLPHWRRVPGPLQRAVWRAWATRQALPGDAAAIAAHVEAKRAAIAAVIGGDGT